MENETISKLERTNTMTCREFSGDVMSTNYGVIPDRLSIISNFSLVTIFYLAKAENRTNKSLIQLSYYYFPKRHYFHLKRLLSKLLLMSVKSRRSQQHKVYFVKLHMCLYLRIKFQVSSIILANFKQGVVLAPISNSNNFQTSGQFYPPPCFLTSK